MSVRTAALSLLARTAAILLGCLGAPPAMADQGITASEVRFAQIAAVTGPTASLGTGMRDGIEAAFAEANRNGGVHGRMLRLDTRDDGYDPARSVPVLRDVLREDAHIALIGATGTPTMAAMHPLTSAAGLPVIGPFTGAAFLRDAELGNVFNLRASYAAEAEEWAKFLVDTRGMKRIAILYQDDSFGRAGQSGLIAALQRRGLTPVAEGTYMRNTVAVKAALIDIRRSKPEAVALVAVAGPITEFVLSAQSLEFTPSYISISFGAEEIAAELGSDGAGMVMSQIVPSPHDPAMPVAAVFRTALAAQDPALQPGFINFEGYLTGRLAIAALQAAGPALTRERYLEALRGLREVDIDGLTLNFSPTDNQGLDKVFLTEIDPDGAIVPMAGG
ncbi:ABC transporter substrate-binding protein [Frigidibacter sp.]|uniref:ABC transporter substrate-binding protein n=1 Tax=Frigidibacter sp. TaxID=2586418 RepID=UPI002734E03E|nr:ABC transporter substrate-binding protein [Frigidibacter sp.]MDP3341335.1 ABC transporter substrate-binding protein [Frigidibacter sp.]